MPLIAISATVRPTEGIDRVRLNRSYVTAAESVGLVPVVVPPLEKDEDVRRVLEAVDGLVLSGGEDIDPAHYGAEPHPATGAANAARDRYEIAMARAAQAAGLPTLAICRGVQVLNVALGGTLVQDIPSEWPDAERHDGERPRDARVHDVAVTPGSRLARALGAERVRVNSTHHQALGRVAAGLVVTASAMDGVVEGVEWDADDWWALGVQWHPEELTRTSEPWDRHLFEAFARACEARRGVAAR